MPRNDEGEFELILGNRQLLSVFFITVILLGVFFTVGYIVGRSSGPVVAADISPPVAADTKPLVVDSAVPAERPVAAAPEPPPESASTKPISTATQQPADTTKEAAPERREFPPQAEAPKSAAAKPEKAKAAGSATPADGQVYLQLSATRRAEADTYVDVLKKKGFAALASPVPENDTLFRVLVGPMPESNINKMRADLQGAGFPGDKAIRKKF